MLRRGCAFAALTLATLLSTGLLHAKSSAPDSFCATYGDVAACASGTVDCTFCHASTNPPEWNAFGNEVRDNLSSTGLSEEDFLMELPSVLASIESEDSDGDGFDNLSEITGGSLPGNPDSVPGSPECPDDVSELDYPICQFSPRHVFRKVWLDFCGCSPSWDDMEAFTALSEDDQRVALHSALDQCLDSEFWIGKTGVLWQLAHPKIRPVGSLKQNEDEGQIPLADYYNDYNLYVWSQMDDNDARSVITADFFIQRNDVPTSYEVIQDHPDEPMVQPRRNGNITTRWFLSYFTMFTKLPRATAAQAYRAYLGYDIAQSQGLFPITVANGYPTDEPVDYDTKDVADAECAACHSTLDPLTYAFSRYNGLTGGGGMGRARYEPLRMIILAGPNDPLLQSTPENGWVVGEEYADLNEWTLKASNSDAFAIASVSDYWRLLMGREVVPSEQEEFEALWQSLKGEHNYSVEKMLHDFIGDGGLRCTLGTVCSARCWPWAWRLLSVAAMTRTKAQEAAPRALRQQRRWWRRGRRAPDPRSSTDFRGKRPSSSRPKSGC